MKVIIVGGNAAGAAAAPRLRRLDQDAEIIVFERGEYITTASCGLPYYIGGITDVDKLYVHTPESFRATYGIDMRIRSEVVRVFPLEKKVLVRDLKTGSEYEEHYDKLLLATGAEPVMPPISGIDQEGVFTLRGIADAVKIRKFIEEKRPQKCVVVGGGSIGVEMAHNLHGLGMEVTIVEFADHIIGPIDFDMAALVQHHLRQKGVKLLLKRAVKAIERNDKGLAAVLETGKLDADMILLSVGVRPESKLAKEAGLALGVRGAIEVNENLRTSDPDIYAAGDAVESTDPISGRKGFVPLAGPANRQGKLAAENICCTARTYGGTIGASVLLAFDMTVASAGLNERTAAAAGIEYHKSFTSARSHAGYYPGATMMTIKLLFEQKTGRVLGAQIVGSENADKICDVLCTAMRANMTVHDLSDLELCYAPPYASVPTAVNMAGSVAQNICCGEMRVFHWHEVDALAEDPDVRMVDVGSPKQYAAGHIKNAVNIPLSKLTDMLPELDGAKHICLYGHSAVAGHAACTLLMKNGFDCRSLSGGYGLYELISREK